MDWKLLFLFFKYLSVVHDQFSLALLARSIVVESFKCIDYGEGLPFSI